ncbi:MCE family protein [candidate division WOR-3 bacterium]|nr:MCE family protein [candidate division WOR-3 bacterium]
MSKRSNAIKVGIFLTIIAILFVFGQLWLLRFNIGREGYAFKVLFNDVSGLKTDDPIWVFGIKKGKVLRIEMAKHEVLITGWLEKSIELREDVSVSIQDVAMISGTKTLILDPGISEEPWDLSKPIRGKPSLGLSTVEIGTIAMQAEQLIKILTEELGESGVVLRGLQSTLNNLNILLKENRAGIGKIINKGGDGLDKVQGLIDDLSLAIKGLNNTIAQINRKQGTLGKLIYDEKLYENLSNASANLDSLLIDVRKNPSRYIHISVF